MPTKVTEIRFPKGEGDFEFLCHTCPERSGWMDPKKAIEWARNHAETTGHSPFMQKAEREIFIGLTNTP